LPNLQDLDKLLIGENAKEALECDLKLERAAHPMLKEAVAYCESCGDYISRELFEDILESEEEHIDYLETQLDLIAQVGLQHYLRSKRGSQSWAGAPSSRPWSRSGSVAAAVLPRLAARLECRAGLGPLPRRRKAHEIKRGRRPARP